MKLNKYIKLLSVACLSFLNPIATSLSKTSQSLPDACHDFDLIRGDPYKAKTLIYGDWHTVPQCKSSAVKCFKALSKNVPPENIIALIENVPSDKDTLCEPYLPESFTKDCRGWNVPTEDFLSRRYLHRKKDELLNLFDKIWTKIDRQSLDQEVYFVNLLKSELAEANAELALQEKKNRELFALYKSRKPAANENNFFSTIGRKGLFEIRVNIITDLLNKLKQGIPYDEVAILLSNDIKETVRLSNLDTHNINSMYAEPNKSMLATIQRVDLPEKKNFVLGGDDHVTSKNTAIKDKKNHKKVIKHFYNELDKNAEKNPSAILSCKLRR